MAKGIELVAKRFCVEVAVYWHPTNADGYGGINFDAPVEIPCRWENKQEIIISSDKREHSTQSHVLVTQDVKAKGYLFRGLLTDIPIGTDLTRPFDIDDAEMIIQFDRIPMVRKTDEFVRTAYTYNYGN